MTRKEFEEIKERYPECVGMEKYKAYAGSRANNDVNKLIHALENGGIKEEPDENDEPELLPCPFCNAGTTAVEYYAGRYVCSADNGGCGAASGGGCPEPDARKKWNTRATTPTEQIIISKNVQEAMHNVQEAMHRVIAKGIIESVDWHKLGQDIGNLIMMGD